MQKIDDPVTERLATVEEAIAYNALYKNLNIYSELELKDGKVVGADKDQSRVVREIPSSKCEYELLVRETDSFR